MLIYNTLTKKKEEFKPVKEGEVNMYVCGPTVYDYFHIGNARSFVMADVIFRYLEYKGYKVNYAMNITDIDDKLIKKAGEQGREVSEIAANFTKAFFDDLDKLMVKKANIYPQATENIPEMIDVISGLIENGKAYEVYGDVFYDVREFENYGKLSGKNIDELESGSRIEVNRAKRNPLDFVLWKNAKEGEPFWESPWGKGRPGWHLECSAMSMKYLGKTIDIHAGGTDLIFPHHENEIAQSEGCCTPHFVNYWIHFGFLNIQNEKMSKSLGNFFTARDVLKKFSAETVRLFFNQTHYAGPLSFSDELLASSQKAVEKIYNFAEEIENRMNSNIETNNNFEFDFHHYKKSFEEAMDDNFNTPRATAVVFDFIRAANSAIAENQIDKKFLEGAKTFLIQTAENVLGIFNSNKEKKESGGDLEDELINLLIELRHEAKKDKNYQLSDDIRDKLSGIGIQLKDTKEGTTFKKVDK